MFVPLYCTGNRIPMSIIYPLDPHQKECNSATFLTLQSWEYPKKLYFQKDKTCIIIIAPKHRLIIHVYDISYVAMDSVDISIDGTFHRRLKGKADFATEFTSAAEDLVIPILFAARHQQARPYIRIWIALSGTLVYFVNLWIYLIDL